MYLFRYFFKKITEVNGRNIRYSHIGDRNLWRCMTKVADPIQFGFGKIKQKRRRKYLKFEHVINSTVKMYFKSILKNIRIPNFI